MTYKRSLLIALAVLLSIPVLRAQSAPDAAKPAQSEVKPAQPAAPPAAPLTPEKRGDIYMARKMYREAIEQYKLCPQTAVVLNKSGIARHQLADLGGAKKFYERAIRKNPRYSEAVNNLGTVYYATKSYRKAVAQYKKALEISPNSASVYGNLGTAHFARKQYKEAAESYQKAIALDPEVFEHRSSYGELLQERNVEERAKFHYYLAKTFAQAGNAERAIQYMRKSIEEGFKDRKKYLEESEFAALQELPEFKEVMALEPRVL
jgi:tetratricopeptide (TPR) repeat protein